MNGKGVYSWPDGTKYEGQFINDLKNGQGVLFYTDGRKYDGGW